MKKLIFSILFFCLPLMVNATDKSSFTITCDNSKVSINDQIICRTSVKADFNYNKISFNISLTPGLSILDVRSNYEAMWNIKEKDNTITAKTSDNVLQTGLQEFGIILLKANASGVQKVTLSNIKTENSTDNTNKTFDDTSADIKVISSDNNLKGININDKAIDSFSAKNTEYDLTINNEEKIKIDALKNNEFATVTGNGEFELDKNNNSFVFPIIVTSESGANRIYLINVKRANLKSDGIDKLLKNLLIKDNDGNTLLFSFNPKTLSYDIDLDDDIKSLNINPTLNNETTSFVKGFEKQTLKIVNGDNIALIKIVDENGQVQTYIINITKPLSNKSDNSYLSNLYIKGYKLSFSKRVRNYTLKVSNGTKSLNIKALAEDKKASVDIEDNENLKNNSVIKVIVTAENESKTIYQITIQYSKSNYITYLIWLIIIVSIILIIHELKENKKIHIVIKKKDPIINKTEKIITAQTKAKITENKTKTTTKKKSQTKKKNNKKSSNKKQQSKRKKNKK